MSRIGASVLLNKIHCANLWLGSYKINNPQKYLDRFPKPVRWPRYNEIVQPPQLDPREERRPATYHHFRENVKTSPKKMWYVAKFVRGMTVDEALKQLSFLPFRPAHILIDVIKDGREIALKEHNFEFKSDMWIEDIRVGKGLVIKGLRKHARMRFGVVNYFYTHVNIKLTEGQPPQDFYVPKKDGNDRLKDFYDGLRVRRIPQGL